MANLNKVMLIGRLTNQPETRTFSNGGKVTNFRFAANNRRKNMATGQWEDDPMFIDVKVFNRGESGRQADLIEQNVAKGQQLFIEGHLVLEQWEDKQTGQKRSKHVVVVDNFQFLEPRGEGAGSGGNRAAGYSGNNMDADYGGMGEPQDFGANSQAPDQEDIPF